MIYPIIFIIWSAFVLWYCLREFHKDLGQRNVSNHKTVGHGIAAISRNNFGQRIEVTCIHHGKRMTFLL